MSATLTEAQAIVQAHAGKRVRVQLDDHYVEGRLRPHLRLPKDGIGSPRFVVYGRSSNWRTYADPFKDDPEIYHLALRSFARPELHYLRFDAADRIEVAP